MNAWKERATAHAAAKRALAIFVLHHSIKGDEAEWINTVTDNLRVAVEFTKPRHSWWRGFW